jgi:hypothetical protein
MRFIIGSGESDALRSSTQVPLKLTEAKPGKAKPSKVMRVARNKRIIAN